MWFNKFHPSMDWSTLYRKVLGTRYRTICSRYTYMCNVISKLIFCLALNSITAQFILTVTSRILYYSTILLLHANASEQSTDLQVLALRPLLEFLAVPQIVHLLLNNKPAALVPNHRCQLYCIYKHNLLQPCLPCNECLIVAYDVLYYNYNVLSTFYFSNKMCLLM